MRIISGKHKGRRLNAPKKLPVRPTTDMAKEGLFNILNNTFDFDTITVLDLFSGTGNISYEFGSRGTKNITAVDAHYPCIRYITKTANELNLPISTVKSDVFQFLSRVRSTYDIIFSDPPYHWKSHDFLQIPDLVFTNELLQKDGVLIVEHSPQTKMEKHPNFKDQRKYGNNIFSFFNYRNE